VDQLGGGRQAAGRPIRVIRPDRRLVIRMGRRLPARAMQTMTHHPAMMLSRRKVMRQWIGQILLVVVLASSSTVYAQQAPAPGPASAQPFVAGTPLKLTPNAKTYGGFRFAESISYDAERDLYVAVNAGIAQDVVPNDGYVSLVNPDGSAHTLKWIGVNRNGLTLNHPLGSDIANGMLYVADIDTVRWFDMKTGEPRGNIPVEGVTRFNDLEVAPMEPFMRRKPAIRTAVRGVSTRSRRKVRPRS
jgi:hypothetical protein